MVRPELIGIIAIAILFLLTVPFFSVGSVSTSGGGSGSDSNQVKVSAADTVADYLFSKLQAGSGITLAIQNSGGDENILISATGSPGDTNCSTIGSCKNVVYQNQDANFNNITVDGNILPQDANSNLGTTSIPFGTLNALRYECLISSGGSCMNIPVNTAAFTSGAGNGFFFNTGSNRFDLRLANVEIFIKYASPLQSNIWIGEPMIADPAAPTGGTKSGTLYIRNFSGLGDYNSLMIYDGNVWREVGDHLQNLLVDDLIQGDTLSIAGTGQFGGVDTNILNSGSIQISGATGDSNFLGANVGITNQLYVDGNIFGQINTLLATAGTSCNTQCPILNNTPLGSTWVCIGTITTIATTGLCSDTISTRNCVCQN